MACRNTVDTFAPEVRRMVQRRLYESGFRDYERLAAELTAAGHAVTKSALHRFGTRLQVEVRKAELASLTGYESPVQWASESDFRQHDILKNKRA